MHNPFRNSPIKYTLYAIFRPKKFLRYISIQIQQEIQKQQQEATRLLNGNTAQQQLTWIEQQDKKQKLKEFLEGVKAAAPREEKVNLCSTRARNYEDFICVDVVNADIVADLNDTWPKITA